MKGGWRKRGLGEGGLGEGGLGEGGSGEGGLGCIIFISLVCFCCYAVQHEEKQVIADQQAKMNHSYIFKHLI